MIDREFYIFNLIKNENSTSTTFHLSSNQICSKGASQLAQHLQGSSLDTLNQISATTQQLLQEKYPHINWEFW